MANRIIFYPILSCVLISTLLTSCKNNDKDLIVRPAKDIYQEGLYLLEEKRFSAAAKKFNQIFYQHPGHDITPQSELMEAYSLFLAGQYEESVDVIDIFIKLHPNNKDIAYAYYLKALCFYMEVSNVKLDQSATSLAKGALEEVINRFPNTKYATDAALKMDLVNEHLAGKEMDIGFYYLSQGNYVAAMNRFQKVTTNYQTTIHIEEALYRMVESTMILGIREEAEKYAAILGHNYPSSKWYKKAYNILNTNKN